MLALGRLTNTFSNRTTTCEQNNKKNFEERSCAYNSAFILIHALTRKREGTDREIVRRRRIHWLLPKRKKEGKKKRQRSASLAASGGSSQTGKKRGGERKRKEMSLRSRTILRGSCSRTHTTHSKADRWGACCPQG